MRDLILYAGTGWSRVLETTVLDPASELLSSHR